MAENPTPRQMAKDLLQGIAPPRPLFLPIVFSLGARVENLPLRAFLSNPTKISNALRQIRSRLSADGVTCYFDPCLEVEALGAALRWQSDDQPPTVCWPSPARKGELPQGLRPPEDAVKAGRIAIAVEVIRRLTLLLRDEALLMAGVNGPFTLAAQLLQFGEQEVAGAHDLPASALETATAMLTQVTSVFLAAGAHVILIHENVLPRLSADRADDWANLLSPTFNIIRFYGALPVLLLTNPAAVGENFEVIANRRWECILCPALEAPSMAAASSIEATKLGIALSASLLPERELIAQIVNLRPAVITTAGDVAPATDVKKLAAMCEEVRR